MWAEMLAVKNVQDSDDMNDVRKTSRAALLNTDEHWLMEDGILLSLSGSTAEARAAAVIKSMLPDGNAEMLVGPVLAKLQTLAQSAQMRMSPFACASRAQVCY